MSATETVETVRLIRFARASREDVFRAWTAADEFKQWWRPGSFKTVAAELDARVGGRYRVSMQAAGGRMQYLFGRYLEVRPPERLVMTWSLEGSENDDGYEALLTLEFRSRSGGTEILLTHEKLPERSLRQYESGWKTVFDSLMCHLGTSVEQKDVS